MQYRLDDDGVRRHKVVSMRLTDAEWKALSRICTRTGRSVSDCLREALGFGPGPDSLPERESLTSSARRPAGVIGTEPANRIGGW